MQIGSKVTLNTLGIMNVPNSKCIGKIGTIHGKGKEKNSWRIKFPEQMKLVKIHEAFLGLAVLDRIDLFKGEYRFLSNFYPCQVQLDGEIYPSVEHAYQAAKTLDHEQRQQFQKNHSPGKIKRLSKFISRRYDWETMKLDIMKESLQQKFAEDPLKGLLIATGDAELIEGNNWNDQFWGMCSGVGENHLGKLLMEIRSKLK